VVARGVNPADAAQVLKTLQDVWDLAAERMLDTVARRLARGITTPGWAEQKAREVLALRGELAAVVARLGQATPDIVSAALDEAYRIGSGAAGVLEQTHIRSRPEVVQRLATRLTANLQGAHLPVIRANEDLFRRAVADSELLMQTGTMTRRDAVAQAVDKLLVQGADRFKDRAGRSWHLDAYARMAGRTMAGQSMVQGQLDGMVDRGRDLVVISDSPRECETCRPWEGRLLSVSGASVGETVDGRRVEGAVAEARAAGLWHPNCTHRADPYTPGLTEIKEPTSNADGYKEQQQLRTLEREARDLKRRLAAAEKLGATAETRKLRAKIRDNSSRIKAHTEATGQLRKRDRERPVNATQASTRRTAPAPRAPHSAESTPNPMDARLSVPRQQFADDVTEAANRRRAADLAALDDAQLDAHLTRATEREDFDDLDAVVAEMERREAAATPQVSGGDQESAQWLRFDKLLDDGWNEENAVAEVFGKSVERQRRDRVITDLRAEGYSGKGFDELTRKAFRDEVYQRYLAAEGATRGHMLTAEAQRAGVNPHTLFSGNEATARKYASDELKEWWDNHGRVTYDQWVADLLGDTQAARDARFRTGGEDFLR
jgi:hypothetical protein